MKLIPSLTLSIPLLETYSQEIFKAQFCIFGEGYLVLGHLLEIRCEFSYVTFAEFATSGLNQLIIEFR